MRPSRLFPLKIILLTFCFWTPTFAQDAPSILATHALMIDLQSGTSLYEKNADQAAPIASLTKLMVGLLTLEKVSLDQPFTVSQNAATVSGSSSYLGWSETFPVHTLLYGLFVPSGNDAALTLTEGIAGSEASFVEQMNQRSLELGLSNMHFNNVTGLDVSSNTASPRDLSHLAQELLTYEVFRQIIQTPVATVTSTSGEVRTVANTNQLLGQTMGGWTVVGMKTGTTRQAGECLMILAKNDQGAEILIVILGSSDRYADAKKLLEWPGSQMGSASLVNDYPIPGSQWPFIDLVTYEPFYQSIVELKAQGILQGDGNSGSLRGNKSLNRAELIAILLRSQGYNTPESIEACAQLIGPLTASRFTDVELDSWYGPGIHCASNLGWVSGDGNEILESGNLPRFRPTAFVTVPEAAKMITQAQVSSPPPQFNGEHWYDLYLNYLQTGGLIEKRSDEKYYLTDSDYYLGDTDDSISRLGAFELLQRVLTSQMGEDYVLYYSPGSMETTEESGF